MKYFLEQWSNIVFKLCVSLLPQIVALLHIAASEAIINLHYRPYTNEAVPFLRICQELRLILETHLNVKIYL